MKDARCSDVQKTKKISTHILLIGMTYIFYHKSYYIAKTNTKTNSFYVYLKDS